MKYIQLLLFVGLLSTCLQAQQSGRRANPNYNKFQNKPFYYGITLGLNSSRFDVKPSSAFLTNSRFNRIEGAPGSGFNIGVIGNLKIGHHFDLRSLINFSFAERQVVFTRTNDGINEIESLNSSLIEVPFMLRFKSEPYYDKRVFVVAGFKYVYDASNSSNDRTPEFELDIAAHDFQFEVGAGIQFFLPYFILSPEIKFSQGMANTLIFRPDDNKSRLIERILSRAITFSLNFEG